MKKVGVTTFYRAYNYGAFLQCFALLKILDEKYDAHVIDYTCPKIKRDYRLIKTTNFKKFVKSLIFLSDNVKRISKFKKCIEYNLKLVPLDSEFDIVIAGSDQIWNIELTGNPDEIYSLNYFKDVKKISYASSIGKEDLIAKYPKIYSQIIENIDFVSVREESAKRELEKISSKDIKVNLDPTLLLASEDWKKYLKNDKISSDYIFSYFVGVTQENYEALNLISDKMGLKVLSYSENPKEKNILRKCFTDDPFEFITKIYHSKLVFTSSFHATVFSIIFNKNFFCMPPKDKGNRIIDLLEKLGLTSRIVKSIDDLKHMDLESSIDYEQVNIKLSELRKDSIEWLFVSLK